MEGYELKQRANETLDRTSMRLRGRRPTFEERRAWWLLNDDYLLVVTGPTDEEARAVLDRAITTVAW